MQRKSLSPMRTTSSLPPTSYNIALVDLNKYFFSIPGFAIPRKVNLETLQLVLFLSTSLNLNVNTF